MKQFIYIVIIILSVIYLVSCKPGIVSIKDNTCSVIDQKYSKLCQAAISTFPNQPIVAKLALVQAIHESGLQGKGSVLANKYNNLFGITKACDSGTVNLPSVEYIKGKKVTKNVTFGHCSDYSASFAQYKQVLGLSRYKAVLEAKDFNKAAEAVAKGGWATDPEYANKLINLYNSILN